MKRSDLLDEAKRIICGEREEQYGTPENNFQIIADFWSVYLGQPITAKDVAIMMTLLKTARIKSGQQKDDNWIDAIGYLACGGEIAAKDDIETVEYTYFGMKQ